MGKCFQRPGGGRGTFFQILAGVFLLLSPTVHAERLAFTGGTDRNPLLYKPGEEMRFKVTLVDRDSDNRIVKGRKVRWTRRGDDGKTESGEALSDTPLTVRTSIGKPGFVRLSVEVLDENGKPLRNGARFEGGAGASVSAIPADPLPSDFHSFWDSAVRKLRATPWKVQVTEVPSPDPMARTEKVRITTFPGERDATALVTVPVGAAPKSLPAIVYSIGYGFGRSWFSCDKAKKGFLCMTVSRHGEDQLREPEYYQNLSRNEMKNFCFRNNESKYENDFFKMLMRNLRALQYIKTRPEWNGRVLIVSGGSMGGFQAIGMAALDEDVSECDAFIPWMADVAGARKFQRMDGWKPGFTEALRYFDTANLATRVRCPVRMKIGLGDSVCQPSGEMILFRNLAGKKVLTAVQNFGHGNLLDIKADEFTFEMADGTIVPKGVVSRKAEENSVPKGSGTLFRDFRFRLLDLGKGHGEGALSPVSPGGFDLTVKNTDPSNFAVACADFAYTGTAQQKLVFRLKGAEANGDARLTVSLAYKVGEKWFGRQVAGIPARDGDFRTITLSLDRDFQLSDASYSFVQLKFSFGGGIRGTTSRIEVREVRLGNPDELNANISSDPLVCPAVPEPAPSTAGVRVFFDFDNDDARPLAQTSSGKVEPENVQSNSFAFQLLKYVDGLLSPAATPENADVIVSSRTVPGAMDKRILKALSSGKKLLIFGSSPNRALAEIQPMQLERRPLDGFPERLPLSVSAPSHPLLPRLAPDCRMVRYFNARLQNGGTTLLAFPDGTPFLAGKGNVLQFASGIGVQTETASPFFYDRGLLRLLLRLGGADASALDAREQELMRKRTEADRNLLADVLSDAGIPKKEWKNWQPGMSRENVGRFGWLVGESLPVGAVSRDLTVSNGSGSFRIFAGKAQSITLSDWTGRVLRGKIRLPSIKEDPTAKWSGEGVVEYSTSLRFDPAWRKLPLRFEVRDGIDDLDEVFLNGRKIGSTDEKTPYYWMTPRRYAVPADAVRWGEENRITIRVTNLRGDACLNSKPQLTFGSAGDRKLSVTKIDWTGKTCRLEENGKTSFLQFSLLSPFFRYVFPGETQLTLAQENLGDFIAFQTASGPVTLSLAGRSGTIYSAARDGKLTSPEILFFRKQTGRPFLLVFQHAPVSIEAECRGATAELITIRWDASGAGELFAGWPFGIRDVDTSSWAGEIPSKPRAEITAAVRRALSYPLGCDELFSVDRKKGTVEILNRFRFRAPSDDWNTPAEEIALLPPMAGWMLRAGRLVATSEKLTDLNLATNLGPVLGKRGRTLRYALPIPDERDFLPVGVLDGELFQEANRFFASGVCYSAGGGTPFNAWSAEMPYGKNLSNQSICPFRWNFGLGAALQGICGLTESNRKALENRLRIRHLEALELYQYKYFARHRREPFSGLDYPIVFNAFFPNATRYEKGFGSRVDYGDANEGCLLIGWIGQQLADLCGQTGFIRANWPYYRYVLRYETTMDDYAFHSGSCREHGIGAWHDMLNGEYAGLLAYRRLAEIAGDRRTADDCLYRAAKRALPSLARFYPDGMAETCLPELRGKSYQLTGFADDGPKALFFPTKNGNFRAAQDLFDFSQGTPGKLLSLYFQEAFAPVREHVVRRAWPSLTEGETSYLSFLYLSPLGLYSTDPEKVLAYARKVVAGNPLMRDWPDMGRPFQLNCVLWALYGKISLSRTEQLNLRKALFNPASGILTIECDADSASRLAFRSGDAPSSIRKNGKKILPKSRKGVETELPLSAGRQLFEIEFPKSNAGK